MKRFLAILLIISLSTTIVAQELMTIGEVFDFEIGDEFQTKYDIMFPNADRITIIDKYFSVNNDSVFYVQYHNSYSSDLDDMYNLVYHFRENTDTITYTNLNNSITTFNEWISYDTSMSYYDTINEISNQYCDMHIIGFNCAVGFFEPNSYTRIFGKGLGLVKYYYFNPADWNELSGFLFYYKKNGISCGEPDKLYVTVEDVNTKPEISILPNPASDFFNVELEGFKFLEMKLFGPTGTMIDSQIVYKDRPSFDCSFLKTGIYYIVINTESKSFREKLLIR